MKLHVFTLSIVALQSAINATVQVLQRIKADLAITNTTLHKLNINEACDSNGMILKALDDVNLLICQANQINFNINEDDQTECYALDVQVGKFLSAYEMFLDSINYPAIN